ncbi:hypothetical protein RchiOBHm_Chr7g0221901 [Rosa chinensis]|uniref:Uncharacterized protein n=1 Tax=Rosa chinensis TaxID=74649 RepID=A0A2P6PD53_ROSCH|nr:hypothetical protein RchiOBHm_Chr7g0221901 [Rosa chinensis]
MNLLSKAILSEGSLIFALMAYRHVVAAICVALRSVWKDQGTEARLVSLVLAIDWGFTILYRLMVDAYLKINWGCWYC